MNQIVGNYSTALVYTDIIEETAAAQIKTLCDQPFAENCRIRIMPDVHAGKGCVIGFTADLGELVIPSIVGVDIGCGMLTIELGREAIDFEKLDRIIREFVPSGINIHHISIAEFSPLEDLLCREHLKNMARIYGSIGTWVEATTLLK